MTPTERVRALRDLVEARVLPADAVERLHTFAWDSEVVLVTLTGGDLMRVLEMFLRGERTKEEVEEWANAVESRDDIGYEYTTGHHLKQIVFQLANPLLEGPLTTDTAEALKKRVSPAY